MSQSPPTTDLGIAFPDLLLPDSGVDPDRWATIACDQHTSNPDYWRSVESTVGDSPSTLRLVLPEVYLPQGDLERRLEQIHQSMVDYQSRQYLRRHPETAVFVRRRLADGETRLGLVVAIDLEAYDYRPEARKKIRASEATIEDRLPVRIRIRENALIETTHVLVLLNDPGQTVIEPVDNQAANLKRLYHSNLMLDGGTVEGFAVPEQSDAGRRIVKTLTAAAESAPDGLLFVVGDGNHSLAAAKKVWEKKKDNGADPDDPARFALVEVVNLYNAGLHFHPIHRVIQGPQTREVLDVLLRGLDARFHGFPEGSLAQHLQIESLGATEIAVYGQGQAGVLKYEDRDHLAIARVEELLSELSEATVDFIHGDREVMRIAEDRDATAVVLPPFDRGVLFPMVSRGELLPRKAFSLGNAEDKRYYFECRAIAE